MSDSETSNGFETVGIKFLIAPDKKGEKESKQSANNMISLIADLAIIGRVAGDVLSKMWSGVQKTVKAGLGDMKDFDVAIRLGVSPEELMQLEHVIGKIGGTDKDALDLLGEMDTLRIGFEKAAVDGGEAIRKFFTKAGVFDLSIDLQDEIVEALKAGDLMEAVKIFGTVSDDLGQNASNYFKAMGISILGNLENPLQADDWVTGWAEVGALIRKVDLTGLNDLQNGINSLKTSFDLLNVYFGAALGGSMADIGDAAIKLTERLLNWADTFKTDPQKMNFIDKLTTFLAPHKDAVSGESSLIEGTLDKAGELRELIVAAKEMNMTPEEIKENEFDGKNFINDNDSIRKEEADKVKNVLGIMSSGLKAVANWSPLDLLKKDSVTGDYSGLSVPNPNYYDPQSGSGGVSTAGTTVNMYGTVIETNDKESFIGTDLNEALKGN